MSIRHAAVKPAPGETFTDFVVAPALVPIGLHRDNFQVIAVVLHALNNVDDHTSQLKITTGLLWALQVSERVIVDVLGQDHFRFVTVLCDARQNRDIIFRDFQIRIGLEVKLVLVMAIIPNVLRILKLS